MKRYLFPILLTTLFLVLIIAVIPNGAVYGSNTDWLSQHITLAETIRRTCLEEKTLLPSWIRLGGGSNGYLFSYYGFLRPDIIAGCLLPHISMLYIVIGYMLFLFLTSILLCYAWLRSENIHPCLSFTGAILFMTAGCMFHMHRQIMFVNYMPFLLLAFLCVKTKRIRLLPLCMLLIILNSFYFSIAAFAAVAWYWYRKEKLLFWKKYFLQKFIPYCLIASGIAASLLLPTAMALLEHKRSGTEFSPLLLLKLFVPNPSMNHLLFNEYGMGLSFICLYAILTGLQIPELKKDSILFLLLGSFGFFCWVLNCGLYVRPKILIPFMPLVILHFSRVFQTKQQKPIRSRYPLWPFIILFPVGLLWFRQKQFPWIMTDAGLLFFFCILHRYSFSSKYLKQGIHSFTMILLLIPPLGLYVSTASGEDWTNSTQTSTGFLSEELQNMAFDPLYHFDSLIFPLSSGNELAVPEITRSTMYSSITNTAYSNLYYDTLLTPIRINNRVALLTSENPFMLHLLGVRYLEATEDTVPDGYQILHQSDDNVIAENKNVLPLAYFTSDVVSAEMFEKQEPLKQLDLITRKTVVDFPAKIQTSSSESKEDFLASYTPLFTTAKLPEGLEIQKTHYGYEVIADKTCTLTFSITNPVPDHIVLLQFQVQNLTEKAVVIDINRIRNKLSGASAPYPNGNTIFHYQFADSGADYSKMEVTFSKGHYLLNDVQWNIYDCRAFSVKNYVPLNLCETDLTLQNTSFSHSSPVLSGTIDAPENGYFTTSIPIQNGLKIFVDGHPAELTTVNTAFAGTYLKKGSHYIEICFSPPGKTTGIMISILSLLLYSGSVIWRHSFHYRGSYRKFYSIDKSEKNIERKKVFYK